MDLSEVAMIIHKCIAHQNTLDSDLYDILVAECRLKENFREHVFKKNPAVLKILTSKEKTDLELFKRASGDYSPVPDEIYLKDPNNDLKWSFDAQRNLEVDLSDFGTAEKQFADSEARKLFGNKVKIK